jgi:hypothetical protein
VCGLRQPRQRDHQDCVVAGLDALLVPLGQVAVLDAARPLPPDEEVLIGDLTEEEDRLFLEAIMSA